jgi:diguanylate cyclase (GGDEF)-like protein
LSGDFDLDELINSHSTRIIETKNKSLSDYDNGLKKNSNTDVFNYDLSDELKFDEDINLGEETEEIVKFENTSGENESTIEEFARLVLTEIESRNLPATPENYKFYFLEMLEREPEPFRHRVKNMLKIESPKDELIRSREIENSLQYSLKVSEQILLITAKLYNNVSIMKNIAIQRSDEATTKNVKDLVQLLKFDLEKLNNVLGRQNDSLKGLYTRAVESVNTVYKQTIFDREFGIYNKKYFIDSANAELEKLNYFQHASTIALIIPHRKLTSPNLTPKLALIIAKAIAKVMGDSFNSSDVVSYYGNNIFAILMPHSNLQAGVKKIEKFIENLTLRSMIIAGKEVELMVKIGITEIKIGKKLGTSLMRTLDALKIANRSKTKVFEVLT